MINTMENENLEDKASKFIYIEGQIWESAKLQVVRNFDSFSNWKILKIC